MTNKTNSKTGGLFLILLFSLFAFMISCDKNQQVDYQVDYLDLLSKQPDKIIEVLQCDKPYEKELSFPCIVTVGNEYIMYYIVYNGLGPRDFYLCRAESSDGINWTKPDLGLVEFDGNNNNNIISNKFEGACVEYHNGIYYLLTYAADFKTYLYSSTDGLIFSKVETFHFPYTCDSQNQIIYDNSCEQYKLYFRSWYKSENKMIIYNHTDSLYRSVSMLATDAPEYVDVALSADPLWRWGGEIPPALSCELPVVMRNTSNEDYDIYNPCVHQYGNGCFIAYPILYFHLPEPAQGGVALNDGYAQLGMWSSTDGVNFCPVTNDYLKLGEVYFEFAIGHIETTSQLIHYYVQFTKTHGGMSWDSKSKIIARIHEKEKKSLSL